jgi:hypothetical protein
VSRRLALVKRTLVLLIPGLLIAILLGGTSVGAAERFMMTCPECDEVDLEGAGLEANARLAVAVRDVRTGEAVIPNPSYVRTNAKGEFKAHFPVDMARHPTLQGSLFDSRGGELVLAAHSRISAPTRCLAAAALPITGAGGSLLLLLAGVSVISLGATMVLWSRRTARTGAS